MEPRNEGIALLLVAVPLAGCLSAVQTPADLPDTGDVDEIGPSDLSDLLHVEHEHGNVTGHDVKIGVQEVAYTTVVEDPTRCNTLEVTVQGDHAYVALTCGSESGFGIVDIADPASPTLVSTYMTPTPYVWDVKVDEAGETAYVGIQGTPGLAYDPPVPPGDEQGVPFSGVQAVDISDKADPTFLASFPVQYGGHNIDHISIDGRDVVMVTVTHVVAGLAGVAPSPILVEDPAMTRVQILEFDRSAPAGPAFQALSSYRYIPDQPVRQAQGAWYQTAHFPHDMVAKDHPETGAPLMYVAYWDAGVRVVDISDPADPVELGAWTQFNDEQAGNIHYVEPFESPIDGRIYAVASPEFAPEDHDGLVHILDVTDPDDPVKVGDWTYPTDVISGTDDPAYTMFSPHNSDVRDGRIYQGAYHAGMWVIDIAHEGTPDDPATVAVYAPTPPADLAGDLGGRKPNVWGTAIAKDTVWISDIRTGLHAIETIETP